MTLKNDPTNVGLIFNKLTGDKYKIKIFWHQFISTLISCKIKFLLQKKYKLIEEERKEIIQLLISLYYKYILHLSKKK